MYNNLRQTAFDRPVDIYIQNNTDKDFQLFKTDLQSGILTIDPPSIIKAGTTARFKGDQSGLVGSSGYITYKFNYSNFDAYVSFYWSHPEGATASIYFGYSSPYGLLFITPKNNLDPNQRATQQHAHVKDWITNEVVDQKLLELNPTGKVQSITYLVQYSLSHGAI